MDDLEEAAVQAAQVWMARKQAAEDLREIVLELLKTKNMSQVSAITGIQRTTLYYVVWGRNGKSRAVA